MRTSEENHEKILERLQEIRDLDARTTSMDGLQIQVLGIIHDLISNNVAPQDVFGDVLKFHRKFGLEYVGKPRKLPKEILDLRIRQKKEELSEYLLAVEEDDEAAQLDALIDLVYFCVGTMQLHGWDGREAWRRVQAANMEKRRAEFAEESKRGSSFDVVKPEGWVAPDHSDLVNQEKGKKK